jgi:4-amino-4-deoxy-L-arabinose transferase-like glycosyltransferase
VSTVPHMNGRGDSLRDGMPPIPLRRERLWIAVVLAASVVLTFYRLGAGSLWDQDETKYAQIAREILETGDPITLHINGQPWYVHPPFYVWLVAATGRVFGFSEFTVRFWSAAFGVIAVYTTILIGRAWFGPRAGVLAGAILAVTLQFLVQSRLAVFDIVLVAWMLLAVYAFVRAYREGRRRDYLWFFLFAGLATLTKGPIGLVLPGLVIAAFAAIRRAWGRWREVPWIPGLALYAAVGLSWYAAEAWVHGRPFVDAAFGYYTVGRFFGVVEGQSGPWYYYVPVVLFGAMPWMAFWPAAAAYHFRRHGHDDASLFVLLWVAVAFVFYSVAGTKVPNYILPIYPFAALGVGALWDSALGAQDAARAVSASAWGLAALVAALYVGIAGYLVHLGQLYPISLTAFRHVLIPPAAALAVGSGLAIALTAAFRRPLAGFVAVGAAMAVTWIGMLAGVVQIVEAQKPMKPLALAIHGALQPGDRIVGYPVNVSSSLIFYADHRVQGVETPEALRREVCAPGRVFVVLTPEDWRTVRDALPAGLRPFAEREGVTVLLKPVSAARCSP